jgi:uncharacterized protein (DUF58 family)
VTQGPAAGALGDTDPAELAHTRAVLRRLELDVSRRLDGILHGDHRGLVPGHGSEPGEAREYQPGDDVRRIDWNVTARTNAIHLRDTIADRELECWLCVDRSASLAFGTAEREKADVVLAAAAGVGVLTSRGGNRIGGLIVGSAGATVVPARQGRAHLLGLLSAISRSSSDDGPSGLSLGDALRRLGGMTRRRGLVVVMSDFLDEPDQWRHQLAALGQRHQVMCIEVVDPRELELPDAGTLTVIDTETGRIRDIDTRSRKVRDRYQAAAKDQRAAIAAAIRSTGAEHLILRTDQDWVLELARFVMGRRRRLANVSVGARRS